VLKGAGPLELVNVSMANVIEDDPTGRKPMPSLASNPRYTPLRLLYAGTALLIVVLLATNAAVILHLRESELLNQEGQLKNLGLTLAEQADRAFQSVDLVISNVAEGIAAEGVTDGASFVRKMAGPDVHVLLREKITGIPQLVAVTVISGEGKLINFSRPWPVPEIDVSDRSYFRALKDDPTLNSYISEPVLNRVSGDWTIFLAHRVSGANGELLGLILGAIEMRYFEAFYQAISLGEGSTIALQRTDGVMLARIPPTDAIGKVFSGSQRLLRGDISGTLRERSPIDGQMRIKAAHLLTNYPVVALATKTEEAALTNWCNIARLMSLGALGCAISIAVAGFAVGRQWKQQTILADAQAELRRQEDRTAAFEAMKAAKDTAEMADRTKSEFLANMSHELRTPLNAILGFSEVMVSEVFGPLGNDRYRGYAQDIHSSGSHLLSIINDVLDLSKAAAGKLELVEGWIDAREIVSSVCRLIDPRIGEAKLLLTVKLPPGNLITYADERLLRQILLNLLSNACKFTPPGGHVECSVSVDAGGMTFAVTDTGIGIPAEHLEGVLQPFVQVDSSLSRRHDGTGLGLALVKVMVELHGGSLRLDSEVGCGTTASVILPLSRVNPASTDIAPENATSSWPAERMIA
jgi:signal transduction histidine kinase